MQSNTGVNSPAQAVHHTSADKEISRQTTMKASATTSMSMTASHPLNDIDTMCKDIRRVASVIEDKVEKLKEQVHRISEMGDTGCATISG